MPSLIQYEYIIAVDSYRHFATAAEKCFVTQPTLSMQIKKLEEEMGVLLFDRSKQPVIPTDLGKKIIAQARIILREAEKIDEIINSFKGSISGNIRIGIIPSLAPYLISLFIGKLTKKYPDLKINIVELLTEEIVENLHKDLLDVGIVVTPLKEEGISEKVLFFEPIKVYVNSGHPLFKKENIELSDVKGADIWLLGKGHCFRHQIINLCSYETSQKNYLPFQFQSGSIETLKKLVDQEGGLTLLPEIATYDIPNRKKIQLKEFNGITPLREVSMVYPRSFAKQRLLELLSDIIRKAVPKKMLNEEQGMVVEWK